MNEKLGVNKAEAYWQSALRMGLRTAIHRGRISLGRAFEYVGLAMVQDLYPSSEDYIVTTPRVTADLRLMISPEQDRAWGPRFPDGLILKLVAPQKYRLMGFVEYKTDNLTHIDDLRNQLRGFNNLFELLRFQDGNHGKVILAKLLGRRIKQLDVPGDMQFYYLVPRNRTSQGIANTMVDLERIQELHVPISTDELERKLKNLKRNRTR